MGLSANVIPFVCVAASGAIAPTDLLVTDSRGALA